VRVFADESLEERGDDCDFGKPCDQVWVELGDIGTEAAVQRLSAVSALDC